MKNLLTTLLLTTTYALAPLKAQTLSVNAEGDPYQPVDMQVKLEDIPVQCSLTARNDVGSNVALFGNFTFIYWLDIDVTMHYSSNYTGISITRVNCSLGEVVTNVYTSYSYTPVYEYVLLGNDLTFEKEIQIADFNNKDMNDVWFSLGIETSKTSDKTFFAFCLQADSGQYLKRIDTAVFKEQHLYHVLGNADDLTYFSYNALPTNSGADIGFTDYRDNINYYSSGSTIPRPTLSFTGKVALQLYPLLEPVRRAYVLQGDALAQKYLEGVQDGYNAGKSEWYPKGVQDGSSNMGVFTIIGNAFTGLTSIFNVDLGGGFTIGLLLCIPLAVTIIIVIVKLLGGGS